MVVSYGAGNSSIFFYFHFRSYLSSGSSKTMYVNTLAMYEAYGLCSPSSVPSISRAAETGEQPFL